MEATTSRKLTCQICGHGFLPQNGAIGENVRPSLAEFIKSRRPNWDSQGFICFDDLGAFRRDYVKGALEDEIGELTTLDHEVIESLRQHAPERRAPERRFWRRFPAAITLSQGNSRRAFGGLASEPKLRLRDDEARMTNEDRISK